MPSLSPQTVATNRALNILTKWRVLLAGWQLGTRPKTDPVAAAVRDHRELTLMLRAEVSALLGVLIRKNAITEEEWLLALQVEAEHLNQDMARRFPGVTAAEDGLTFRNPEATETMKGWLP